MLVNSGVSEGPDIRRHGHKCLKTHRIVCGGPTDPRCGDLGDRARAGGEAGVKLILKDGVLRIEVGDPAKVWTTPRREGIPVQGGSWASGATTSRRPTGSGSSRRSPAPGESTTSATTASPSGSNWRPRPQVDHAAPEHLGPCVDTMPT